MGVYDYLRGICFTGSDNLYHGPAFQERPLGECFSKAITNSGQHHLAIHVRETRISNNQNIVLRIEILNLLAISCFGLPSPSRDRDGIGRCDIARIHCTRLSISGASSLYPYFASQVWAREFGFLKEGNNFVAILIAVQLF